MDAIADRYADRAVRSVFIYTREAHPGELYRHHTSMEGKRDNARALREVAGVKRQILLDAVDGPAHQAYGMLPNMTWIFGRGGLILHKAGWTAAEDVEKALTYHLEQLPRRAKEMMQPVYTENVQWRVPDQETFMKVLERNGPQAIKDFEEGMKHMPPPQLEPEED